MPNTFVHLGIQTLGSRALLRGSDFKWIAVGCLIPDVPWIVQRVFLAFNSGISPFGLRHYATVQASLFGCLILSGVFALTVANGRKLFLLLAFNSLLHLLLDAVEIKWANGVHFLAPFSWRLTGFNVLWPEHVIISILTFLGVLTLVYSGSREWKIPVVLSADRMKYVLALLLLTVYFFLPLLLASGPARANNHFASTLLDTEARPGKYLELDRSLYRSSDKTVRIFSGERFRVLGMSLPRDAVISVRGNFIDKHTIHISEFHVHSPVRDISSKAALIAIMSVWLVAFVKKRITFRQTA